MHLPRATDGIGVRLQWMLLVTVPSIIGCAGSSAATAKSPAPGNKPIESASSGGLAFDVRAAGKALASEIVVDAQEATVGPFDGPFPGYPLPDIHLCGSGGVHKQSAVCKTSGNAGGLANGTTLDAVEQLCGADSLCVGFTQAVGVFYPLANITTVRSDYQGWKFWQKHGYRPPPSPPPAPSPSPAPPGPSPTPGPTPHPSCGDMPPPPPPGPPSPRPPPGPPWMPPPKQAGSGPKTVFAHYMMCFHAFGQNQTTCGTCEEGPTCQYANAGYVDGYVQEISHGARYGLDGFALEWLVLQRN